MSSCPDPDERDSVAMLSNLVDQLAAGAVSRIGQRMFGGRIIVNR